MPKAIQDNTPSRRVFIGATTIGLLAGGSVAALAAVPGPNPDAALLAACEAFHACQARIDTLNEHGCEDNVMDHAAAAWNGALDRVTNMTARTPEGLCAQAGAAIMALRIQAGVSAFDTWEQCADPAEKLVMAVLERVVGRV